MANIMKILLVKYVVVSILIIQVKSVMGGNQYIDSLEKELNRQQAATKQKVELLNRLSFAYRSMNPGKTEALGHQALELSRELEYPQGKGNAYQFIGISHWFRGHYDKAHKYLNKSIQVHKQIDDLKGLGQNYLNQGNIYNSEGNHKMALKHYFNALENGNKLGDKRIKGKALNNIGAIYYDRGKYDKALKYYKQSLSMRKQINDRHGMSSCFNNIGNVYDAKNKTSQARKFFQKSLDLKRKLNDKNGIAHTLNNLGTLERDIGNLDSALQYFEQSLEIKREMNDVEGIVETRNNIGELLMKKGKANQAKVQFQKACQIADTIGAKRLKLQSYANLVSADSSLGNFKQALAHQNQYMNLKGSLFNAKKSKQIAAVEAKYQTAKKEAQLEKNERQIYLLSGGLVLILLLATVVIGYYRHRQQSDKLRAEKNEALAHQRRLELDRKQKETELKSIIEGQEIERKRMGEELHDGIGARLASLKLSISNKLSNNGQSNGKTVEKGQLEKEIDFVCQEVRAISHNLMPPTLLQNSLTYAIKDFINETNYTQPYLNIDYDIFSEEQINKADKDLQMSIYRIVQELINNVIKHANATQAHLQLVAHEDYLNLILEDNGKGFDPDQIKEGVGLKNIQSRVDILNGDLKIESTINSGSLFNLNIPFDYATASTHHS